MGYQKIILCLNDGQSAVDEDPVGWWKACTEAFWRLWRKPHDPKTFLKQPEDFGHGCHANAWQAVWEDHVDNTVVIIAGGNHATVFGCYPNGGNHHTEEHQIAVLKAILRSKGYRISKCKTMS